MASAVPSVGNVPPTNVVMWIDDAVAARSRTAPEMPRTTSLSSPTNIDKLVAAFVRIRGIDRLEGAIISRCWLAADMDVAAADLDRLLKLLRWQGLVGLPNEHLVTVNDAAAMRDIALVGPACAFAMAEPDADGDVAA